MDGRIQQLTLRHDNIRSTSQKTKESILEAVGWLESENAQLRNLNADIMAQMRRLADDNDRIKQQLASAQSHQQQNSSRVTSLQEANSRLKADLEAVTRKQRDEKRRVEDHEAQLRQENAALQKQIDALETEVGEMAAALTRARQETVATTAQLSRAQRRNFNDRDIELLHEVDVLRDQQRHAQRLNDEAEAANVRLQDELAAVRADFDEKVAELRNESRRHTLLTKEFNSLLDENNTLKQQMRRRRQGALLQQQAQQQQQQQQQIQQQQQQRDIAALSVPRGDDTARNNPDAARPTPRPSDCISERMRAGTTLNRARSMFSLGQPLSSQPSVLNQLSPRNLEKNTFAREASFLSRESTFFRHKNVNGLTKTVTNNVSIEPTSTTKTAEVTGTEPPPGGNLPMLTSAKTWRP